MCLFRMTGRISKKLPASIKQATIICFTEGEIMQCIAKHSTGIHSYLQSLIRYIFLILDTNHLDTYLCAQGCKDLWLLFKAKRVCQQKSLGNTD